jgi:hypothetical protein
MLSHGVVVTLDGMPWSRIVAHVSDDADEEDGLPAASDDEGEWEDDWEHAGNDDEALANTSCTDQGQGQPRRRRKHRASDTAPKDSSSGARRTKPAEKHASAGQRWDRERAVVVVYDLDPSKEHEIELQIVGLAGEVKENLGGCFARASKLTRSVPVSNAVLIPPIASSGGSLHPRSRANSLRSRSRPRSRSNSVNTAATPAPLAPSPLGNEVPSSPTRMSAPIPDATVVPTSILSPIDAQTAQTRHQIAAAHAEREHLQLQIKEARKTAQRSEAALRTDIESMKRSNEKAGGNDQRNKQKYLALQEQVKQGWAGAETANAEAEAVKGGVPEIEAKLKTVTADLAEVRLEWKKVKEREEAAREGDKKTRAEEDRKLADLETKIDKVRSRKDKRESERAELQKKLDELEKQREHVERKAEESKTERRAGYFPPGLRWDQGGAVNAPEFNPRDNAGFDNGRTLSAHPSMNNLNSNYAHGPGTGFRPRGGYHRYPSGGSRPPPAAQQSPAGSPAWQSKGGNSQASRSGSGPNPAAAPFMPSSSYSSSNNSTPGSTFDPALHTAFMPPQMQHRIYLPNTVRPRPTPNFHPPPSVLAEQQAATFSPPKTSIPSFPPLPSTAGAAPTAGAAAAAGPSLASIVTRAVLAPTSNALAGSPTNSSAPSSGRASVAPAQAQTQIRRDRDRVDFPPLSPTAGVHSSPRSTPPHTTTPPA